MRFVPAGLWLLTTVLEGYFFGAASTEMKGQQVLFQSKSYFLVYCEP